MTDAEHAQRLRRIRKTKRMQHTKLTNEAAALNGEILSLTAAIDHFDPRPPEDPEDSR